MLLDKEIMVRSKYNYDLNYYKSLGYDIDSEYFLIKIEHLPKKSFNLVNVSCDYCGVIENISFYKYNRSLQSHIKKYCCKDCKGEKIKESNLLKYGVTSVSKLDTSKEKFKQTSLKNWGVENHSQSDIVKSKTKLTNLEKWGVENPMQSDEVKERQRETVKFIYGVDNISKLTDTKDKKKATTFNNFGVDSPLKSEIIKDKIKKTNLEKYNSEYFTTSELYRRENYQIANDPNYLQYVDNGISLFKCDIGESHSFKISKDVYSKRKIYNISLCTVCNPVGDNRSIKESDLYKFIQSIYDKEIIQTYRIGKMEIDIYLPDLKIGFEFNGLYWHSNEYKEKDFHLKKTEYFREKEIRLIHIWEDEWDFKRDIVKNQIGYLLKLNTSGGIFARKCRVENIKSTKIVKDFLNKNHIQGWVNSKIKLGLYYNDELVSIMTFDHFEGRKRMSDNEWNLNRFCSKIGATIPGSASKILNYFIKNFEVKRIISYADRDWSHGELYRKLGFSLVNVSNPDYKYVLGNKRVNKSRLRKTRTGISESKLDIPKIWDCGKMKFELILN